jgi:hypothetical protein
VEILVRLFFMKFKRCSLVKSKTFSSLACQGNCFLFKEEVWRSSEEFWRIFEWKLEELDSDILIVDEVKPLKI